MIKHMREENGRHMLTGAIGHAGSDKTWIVADVDPAACTNQTMIDSEFRRLAAQVLELPIEIVNGLEIFGPTDHKPVSTFELQHSMAETATVGKNVILTGDAVGNCHWREGGGMQMAAVAHMERLKTLIHDLDGKERTPIPFKIYSLGVLQDTAAWCNAL